MITLFDFMEDFDYTESPEYERRERLCEAVEQYNYDNETEYSPEIQVQKYFSWLRDKYKLEM